MSNTVLLVSIGPVQDFIASARRCQDLWFGSWLLSELAKAAALGIFDAAGGGTSPDVMVFPGATSARALAAGSDQSVANKVLARVPGQVSEARTVAEAGRTKMRERLQALRDTAFDRVGAGLSSTLRARLFLRGRAEDQVDELIEYVWVAVSEEQARPDAYARARQQAERLLAARKNTRDWVQPSWGDEVPKSSIDGLRESVLHEDLFDAKKRSTIAREAGASLEDNTGAEWLRVQFGVQPAERLDGVGLLKRWGRRVFEDDRLGERERFYSTSHVAALPFMSRPGHSAEAFDAYAERVRAILGAVGREALNVAPDPTGPFRHADGELLFPNRLVELAEEAGCDAAKTREIQQALRHFLGSTGVSEVLPYYAIVLADGDRMGKAIDRVVDPKAHQALSLELARFAADASKIVRAHRGSLIYSGGDDVLALVPLHRVLSCADELRRCFADALAQRATDEGLTPTLSVGVALVHHLEPMGAALQVARRAEALAKQTRNAIAVIYSPRSGDDVEISGSWERAKDVPSLVERLNELVELLREDRVSDRAAFELAELEQLYAPGPGGALEASLRASLDAVVASGCARILARKQPKRGTEEQLEEAVHERLRLFAAAGPARLGRELMVARVFERALDQAQPSERRAVESQGDNDGVTT